MRIKILVLSMAIFIGGCGVTEEDLKGIGNSCNLIELREQNAFPKECLNTIEDLLPSPENNLNSKLLAFGQDANKRELFVLGASLGSLQLEVKSITNGITTTLIKNTDYTIGKLSDLTLYPLLSISSVLDYSASMSDDDIDDAVTIFSDIYSIFTTPLIESEIRLFSETVYHKLPFNSEKNVLLSSIKKDDTIERESTALLDAMGQGLEALGSRTAPIKVMIVATDGMENASTTYTDKNAIYALANRHNIPVIIIGSLFSDLVFMKELASKTNGIFIYNKTILKVKDDAKLLIEMIKNIQVITITKPLSNGTTFSVSADGKSIDFN
ncbi:MAG: VWA domain-containing protein [Sulfurovum sp.]